MTETKPGRGRAAVLVLVASLSFGISTPIGRWSRPADPLVIAFGRLALAAVVLLLLDARHLGASLRSMAPRHRFAVFGAGALLAAHFGCFQWGLDHTSLPAAASLVSLEPISVVLTAWALFGLKPRPVEWLALGIATLGAVVVASAAGEGEHRLIGDAVVVLAVVLFGLYLAVARGLGGVVPTRSYVALVYAAAAVTMALVLPWSASTRPPHAFEMPLHSAVGIVLLALIPTVIGHTVVQAASRTLSPSIVALVSPGETLGSIAIGAAALGAIPTGREMAGAALILGGTTLALVTSR